jgi:homoserine acetyltransferase
VRYLDTVKRAAPIAGTAKNTVHDFLFTEKLVDAITSDPGLKKGFYASSAEVREGLQRRAKMWAVMGWSTHSAAPLLLRIRQTQKHFRGRPHAFQVVLTLIDIRRGGTALE